MKTIFIYGHIGVGKYTVGLELSKQTGLPLFHNHLTVDLVTSLFEFGTESFKEMRAETWKNAFKIAAKKRIMEEKYAL